VQKLLTRLLDSTPIVQLTDLLDRASPTVLDGPTAPAKALLLAALSQVYPKVVVLAASEEIARALHDDILTFLPNAAYYVPPSDLWAAAPDSDAAALRVMALDALSRPDQPSVLVGTAQAILQRTAGAKQSLHVAVGDVLNLEEMAAKLASMGYERSVMVEAPGQFAVRGGILDVFAANYERPLRIELFGDAVESIRSFEPDSQRSVSHVGAAQVLPAREDSKGGDDPTLLDLVPSEGLVVVDEPNQVRGHYHEFLREFLERVAHHQRVAQDAEAVHVGTERSPSPSAYKPWDAALSVLVRLRRLYINSLPRSVPWEREPATLAIVAKSPDRYGGRMPELAAALKTHMADGEYVAIVTSRQRRLLDLLAEHGVAAQPGEEAEPGVVRVLRGQLSSGFVLPTIGMRVLSDVEAFGERQMPRPRRVFRAGTPILSLLDLNEGDYVVHINHGIGVYRGLARLPEDGAERDFLRIDYAGGDKIYVPTDQLDRVQKYVGASENPPELSRLGSGAWHKTTAKAKAKAKEMARDLLRLYAARSAADGHAYGPDTVWQQEMEEAFPYRETRDQLVAIEEVKRDLERPTPMDRLICGDVGYGKTEVAVRAAFKVATEGKQVAVLVPTTVLAQQHLETFTERMQSFPIRIEMLSRFRTPAERKQVLDGLRDGSVDIVIGTHMLLSKNVQFRDLGLLVVDEEQRFGVAHKERIKQLRASVDVMTLTATPIPRTLHMSLAGIRDMSIINDPPEGRIAVHTYCAEYSDELVRGAIRRELDRGGQVFFVYNRVEKIEHVASRVERLVPEARVGVGHGQMPERLLEQIMWDFYHKRFDVLVCSTIIESGLDIPNANTIIIMDADRLGLAQLYQLRGRVGRSSRQAYCYLLYRRHRMLNEAAQKRLQAIRDFSELGSGFKVAMRDLEIRGAGNLLGPEQSGFMESVGFELYCQMIAEAVAELKGEPVEHTELPPVDIRVDAYIPPEYIATEGLRIAFYRRLAALRTFDELTALREEMEDRFGDLPAPTWNLLLLVRMRLLAREVGIAAIGADQKRATFRLCKRLSHSEISLLAMRHKNWFAEADRIVVDVVGGDVLRTVDENLEILAHYLKPGIGASVPTLKRHRPRRQSAKARSVRVA